LREGVKGVFIIIGRLNVPEPRSIETFREFAPNCQHFKGSAIFLERFRSQHPYNVLVSTNLSNAKKLTNLNDVIEKECEYE